MEGTPTINIQIVQSNLNDIVVLLLFNTERCCRCAIFTRHFDVRMLSCQLSVGSWGAIQKKS